MYSIDINFLKDRAEHKSYKSTSRGKLSLPIGKLSPIYLGLAAGLIFPAAVGASWLLVQSQNTQLENEVAAVEGELNRLGIQAENIKQVQAQTSQIQAETRALATVFNQIRPWSAMLQDLRDRIPKGVQIESIEQTAANAPQPAPQQNANSTNSQPAPATPTPVGGIKISGIARSFGDVNDFLLTLKQSAFLQPSDTKIVTAELVDNPIAVPTSSSEQAVAIKLPPVVKYTIESSVSNVPASEILRELERKGTFGLVTRIRTLQQKGVIQP